MKRLIFSSAALLAFATANVYASQPGTLDAAQDVAVQLVSLTSGLPAGAFMATVEDPAATILAIDVVQTNPTPNARACKVTLVKNPTLNAQGWEANSLVCKKG
jgi:hypothetical protein